MILTENMVVAKSKATRSSRSEDVSAIKTLNLWGQNLSDVSFLSKMTQLEIVSLAVNKIQDLSAFRNLTRLKELYLRKNHISEPSQLLHLTNLPLTDLWIADNPVCNRIPNYRETILRLFPNLRKLDDVEVTEQERRDASRSRNGHDDEQLVSLLRSSGTNNASTPSSQPRAGRRANRGGSPPSIGYDSAIMDTARRALPPGPIKLDEVDPSLLPGMLGLGLGNKSFGVHPRSKQILASDHRDHNREDHITGPGLAVVNLEHSVRSGRIPHPDAQREGDTEDHFEVRKGMVLSEQTHAAVIGREKRRLADPALRDEVHITGAGHEVRPRHEEHVVRRTKERRGEDHIRGAGVGVVDGPVPGADRDRRRHKAEGEGVEVHLGGASMGFVTGRVRQEPRIKKTDRGTAGGSWPPYATDSEGPSFSEQESENSASPSSGSSGLKFQPAPVFSQPKEKEMSKRPSWSEGAQSEGAIKQSIRFAQTENVQNANSPEDIIKAMVNEQRKNNVLYAVLTLLKELDPVALEVVQHKVDVMVQQQGAKF